MAAKKSVATATNTSRKLRPAPRRVLGVFKYVPYDGPGLPGAFKLLAESVKILRPHWRQFGAIMLTYVILSILLVRGLGGSDLPALKQLVTDTLDGKGGDLTVGFTVFGLLLGTSGQTTSDVAGVYQSFLLAGVSLVVIWALRQAYAGESFSFKAAWYKSFYPLVPFTLVLLIIGMQLIPFIIANVIFGIVFNSGMLLGLFEQIAWGALLLALASWSLYMVAASVLALYVVTLPDMQPLSAWRSAKKIVRGRRWAVMRKLLFLPFALIVIGGLIMLPTILFVTVIAEWVFIALSSISLLVVHTYLYGLYRELLK